MSYLHQEMVLFFPTAPLLHLLFVSFTVGRLPLLNAICGASSYRNAKARFTIDKTNYIRTLEKIGAYNTIWRPRGFGKTFVCDMLAKYYDAINSDDAVIILA
jgi:hypothetical protein